MKRVLITGSSGLVGSACVRHFDSSGWESIGLDNHERADYFGLDADPHENSLRLANETTNYYGRWPIDITNRIHLLDAFERTGADFDLIIHCAAQPSHDWATKNPRRDFEVNALGTLNLLEAVREYAPEATFIFMSTNKVYGDAPNDLPFIECPTRFSIPAVWHAEGSGDWDKAMDGDAGIGEWISVDSCRHSIFGASKLAADIMVQEYGRTYGMKTCCFRAGCLTGSAHAAVELHGFLAYLVKCAKEGRLYRIYGYKGKQVRDNLHAYDVARACEEFAKNPKIAAVYNLGGGRENSISILEAIEELRKRGYDLKTEYVDEPRGGDHICYYSDTTKFRTDYPGWNVTKSLADIFDDLCGVSEPIHV